MFGSLERVKEMFGRRFEPDGEGYLFRANLRAVAYSVSADERERMLAQFSRRLTWLTWGAATLFTLVMLGVVWVMISQSDQTPPDALIWVALGVFLGLYLIPVYLLWNAPVRELKDRAGVAAGRTKPEATRIAFERLTWGQLGVATLTVPVLLWRVGSKHNLLAGWNRVWLVAAAALLLLIAIQAFRKWRWAREPRHDDP